MNRIRVKSLLYLTAIPSIGFLTALVCATLGVIRKKGLSRDFLQVIDFVPPTPQQIALAVLVIIVMIVLLEAMLELACSRGQHRPLLYLLLLTELFLCIAINYFLCCTYRNALYLVIGNTIIYPVLTREKVAFILLASLCYIFIDVNQVAAQMLPFSFNVLIDYLGDGKAQWMTLMSALRTLNDISFILLCLYAISETTGEKKQIEALNNTLQRTIDELHVSNVQLALQAKHDEQFAISRERLRFSSEMHDIIGHVLTAVVVGLSACDMLARNTSDQLSQQLKSISTLASNGLNELRRAVHDTRSSSEENPLLVDDVRELVSAITACVNIDIRMDILDVENIRLNSIQENMIYRIVQESITNAVRHARADTLSITIKTSGDYIHIEMKNDGIVGDQFVEGFGLSSMRERVTGSGGRMSAGVTGDRMFLLSIDLLRL